MGQKNSSLSYERLVSRAKYYKDKSLQLEQDVIYAKEKIAWLENRLDKVKNDVASRDEPSDDIQQKIQGLQESYRTLEKEYRQQQQQQQMIEQQYKDQIAELRSQMTTGSLNNTTQQHYEHLLSQVQIELNDKEQQIEIYKKRLTSLEKRLKSSGQLSMTTQPTTDDHESDKEMRIIAYFDYALIVNKEKSVIRGDYTIENIGNKAIHTPYICFRFYPADAAHIKGRTIASHDTQTHDDSMVQWQFLENEWANEAKERGEIWIHPVAEFQLNPDEKVLINDFQIPIDTKICDHVTIESFVYSETDHYRVKSMNNIIANF